MKTVIEMAREAGFDYSGVELSWESVICTEELERFAELVRVDERERIYFQTSSDFVKAAIADEREACARIAEEPSTTTYECTVACGGPAQTFTQRFPKHSHDIAKEIRARGQA